MGRATRLSPENSWRYSAPALAGTIERTLKPNPVGTSVKPGSGMPRVWVTSPLPSISASSTFRPDAAANAASAAATVDFPVPPFPEMTTTGRSSSSSQRIGSL